jgi:hypothetical protein
MLVFLACKSTVCTSSPLLKDIVCAFLQRLIPPCASKTFPNAVGKFSFFEFSLAGLIFLLISIPIIYFLSKKILPKKETNVIKVVEEKTQDDDAVLDIVQKVVSVENMDKVSPKKEALVETLDPDTEESVL